jgi:hypothetical protein
MPAMIKNNSPAYSAYKPANTLPPSVWGASTGPHAAIRVAEIVCVAMADGIYVRTWRLAD